MSRTLDEWAESAKKDDLELERLMQEYQPFILGRVYNHGFGERDEAISVALGAFYEAVHTYTSAKGSFLAYAGRVIQCRLIDSRRKAMRQRRLLVMTEDVGTLLNGNFAMKQQKIVEHRETCHSEIEEFAAELAQWGIALDELEASSPRHAATKSICSRALRCMVQDSDLACCLRENKKLPLKELAQRLKVNVKQLERHRRYLVAAWLIQTGDYMVLKDYVPCGALEGELR